MDAIRAYDKLYQAKQHKQIDRDTDMYDPADNSAIIAAIPLVRSLANQHRIFAMPLGMRVQAIRFVPRVGPNDPDYKAPDYTSTLSMDMYYSEGFWCVKVLDGPKKDTQVWTVAVVTPQEFKASPSYALASSHKPLDVISSISYDTDNHELNQSSSSYNSDRTVHVRNYIRHSRNGRTVFVHRYYRRPPSR